MKRITTIAIHAILGMIMSGVSAEKIYPELSEGEIEPCPANEPYKGGVSTATFTYKDGQLYVDMRNMRLYSEHILQARPYIDGDILDLDITGDALNSSAQHEVCAIDYNFHFPVPEGKYTVYYGELFQDALCPLKGHLRAEEVPFELDIREGLDLTFNVEFNVNSLLNDNYQINYSATLIKEDPYSYISCRFIGTEEIDGKEYHKFYYCQGFNWNDEEKHLIAYMRGEGANIYTLPVDELLPRRLWLYKDDGYVNPSELMEGETLVYSFAPPMYPEKIMVPNVLEGYFEAMEVLHYDWRNGCNLILNNDVIWSPTHGSIGTGCGLLPYPVYNYQISAGGSLRAMQYAGTWKIPNNEGEDGVGTIADSGHIGNDDAQPEYFTLDGLRVAEPRSGQLLIRRQGSKVEKVLK